MANDNLAGYLERTRRWLKQPSSSISTWTDTFLINQINANYRIRCATIIRAHEGHFVMTAVRNLVGDQATYPWPSGMERCNRIELVRSDNSRIPIRRYDRNYEMTYDAQAGDDGYYAYWRPISGGFILEPPPLTTVTNGLRVEYTGLPPFIEADGDAWHPDFPRIFDELIILDTVIDAMDSQGMLEQGITKTIVRKLQALEVGFIEYINNKYPGQSQYIVPVSGSYPDA